MSNDFEGKWHKGLDILKKVGALTTQKQSGNMDMQLNIVCYTNLNPFTVIFEQDEKYVHYVQKWKRPAISRCELAPGQTATFAHDYMVIRGLGVPDGEPMKLEKRWGRDRLTGGKKE